ncbi:MAG: NAD(P)/FAD-dependent oxidoreductase [Cyanobacteria bacterium NC_groundwater_1444_Ag_S-0.65um_54_12]|nr:NAD(P)/FAD-dependent oxidoreductase [Cyanobacteria bacterium NC_groundwater_1444_Ag_S-0.65um_54_12]
MTAGKTALILGGGVGGLVTAHTLLRVASDSKVTLIDREREHLFAPSLLWLLIGDRRPEAIKRPLSRLERKGIRVVTGEIEQIDPQRRTVRVNGQELGGDALVITLGAELAPQKIPGLQEAGCNLYTLEGVKLARDALHRLQEGRIVVLTAVPAYKCPAAPYEAAMLAEYDCRRRKVRAKVEIDVYAAEPGPMGVAGPEVSGAVKQALTQKGITYHPSHQVVHVDAENRTLHFENGASAHFDLLIYVPPHQAPAVVRNARLCGESGWMATDRHTLETAHSGVYAFGDVVSIPLQIGKPLPKAGVFAHHQAEVVARNIAASFSGRTPTARFAGFGECFLEMGDGQAALGRGNFYGEPSPQVAMRKPSRFLHWGKVLFEKDWLRRWF